MANTKNKKLLMILILAAIIIIIPVLTPNMYIMQIINMICIYIILGTSINVLTGFTGQLSLGQAAFFGIGAYTAALLNTRAGLQFIPCMIGSVLLTALFGVVLAVPALKVKGSYLALLTMGFGEVVRIVMINWTPVTNGTAGILGIESPVFFGFAFDTLGGVVYPGDGKVRLLDGAVVFGRDKQVVSDLADKVRVPPHQ